MKNKRNITLLAIVILYYGSLYAQWTIQNVPTTDNLNSVFLLNESTAWAVGDNGTILHKNSDIWIKHKRVTNRDLHSVFFIDSITAYAVGSGGTILHYDGNKWKEVQSPTQKDLFSVSFINAHKGVAVGAHGTVLIFENGTWNITDKTTRGNFYSVATRENLVLLAGGLECVNIPVMTMMNNAKYTLVKHFDPSFTEIRSLVITKKGGIWAVGSPGEIFHSKNNQWEKVSFDSRLPSLNSVFFSDDNKGIIVGHGGTILLYSKSKWVKEASPVNVRLNSAAIAGNAYYAVGNNGTIVSLKREPEVVSKPRITVPTQGQITSYPNPSKETISIVFPEDMGDNGQGILTIVNGSGKMVIKNNIAITAGETYNLPTFDLENGLYMVTIKSNNGKTATGKFIVNH